MHPTAHSLAGPTETEIQHAAYLLWIEEGRPEGRDLAHWLAAQHRLRRPGGTTAERRAGSPAGRKRGARPAP